MNEDILVSHHGRVAVITLNRPARLNAWTTAMREMIIDALARFDADDVAIGDLIAKGETNQLGIAIAVFQVENIHRNLPISRTASTKS